MWPGTGKGGLGTPKAGGSNGSRTPGGSKKPKGKGKGPPPVSFCPDFLKNGKCAFFVEHGYCARPHLTKDALEDIKKKREESRAAKGKGKGKGKAKKKD